MNKNPSARIRANSACRFSGIRTLLVAAFLAPALPLLASDHADPTDLPFQPGGIPADAILSDLFVFPVGADGKLVTWMAPLPTPVTADGLPSLLPVRENATEEEITDLVVILCVRPGLVNGTKLKLEPYTYTVHFDLTSGVSFDDPWNRARYGGTVVKPEDIHSDVSIQFELNNEATFKSGFPKYEGLNNIDSIKDEEVTSGIVDDPFIFRDFAETNAVGMVVKIPISCFPRGADQKNFIAWATSFCGKRQQDHAGRSLRTQNPRFGLRYRNLHETLLNTTHPSKQAEAVTSEHEHPSLVRDLFVEFGFESYFALRQWDHIPDVMIYSTNYPAGFPNGRALKDDVVELTARYGDSLAFELSYLDNGPRLSAHDPPFNEQFPYLLDKRTVTMAKEQHDLSSGTVGKLILLVVLGLLGGVIYTALVIKLYKRRQRRKQLL